MAAQYQQVLYLYYQCKYGAVSVNASRRCSSEKAKRPRVRYLDRKRSRTFVSSYGELARATTTASNFYS
eukprot:scaffold283265_cov49-Prasinocladus_malaysianus.AAC.1